LAVILDTNAISAFFDGVAEVVQRVAEVPDVFLPVIVIGEYLYGLQSSRERVEREKRFKEFCRVCKLLAVDEETSGHYAIVRHRLRLAGTPIPENDIWIAALAFQHGQQVLSNDRHFDAVEGVNRIGW
jgi:tRNA(fMet)-specific endonuclease VapC